MDQQIQRVASDPSGIGEWVSYVVAGLVTGAGAIFGGKKIAKRRASNQEPVAVKCSLDFGCVVKAINDQGEMSRQQAERHHGEIKSKLDDHSYRLGEIKGMLHR